jgi:hypothetical protein
MANNNMSRVPGIIIVNYYLKYTNMVSDKEDT